MKSLCGQSEVTRGRGAHDGRLMRCSVISALIRVSLCWINCYFQMLNNNQRLWTLKSLLPSVVKYSTISQRQQKNTAAQPGVKLLFEHFRLKFTWKHQGMEGKPGHFLPLLDRNSEAEFLRRCRAKISQQPSCLNVQNADSLNKDVGKRTWLELCSHKLFREDNI